MVILHPIIPLYWETALTYSKTLGSDSLAPKALFFVETKFGVNLCFRKTMLQTKTYFSTAIVRMVTKLIFRGS